MTRKSLVLLAVGFALAVTGLFIGDRGSTILGLMMMAFVLVGSAHSPLKLKVERELSRSVTHVGTMVDVALDVEAMGSSDRVIEVHDEFSHRLWVDSGAPTTMVYLDRGDRLEFMYSLYCPLRGYMRIGPLKVRSRDVFGLSWNDRVVDVRDSLTVYPALDLSGHKPRRGPSAVPEMGQRSRTRLGLGTEFMNIRDYLRGDPFRFINWKATAKQRRYMVNEFEQEATSDVMIFIDLREPTKRGTPTLNAAERSSELAATLAEHFVGQRHEVGLVLYGKKALVLPPGTGERQLQNVLHALTGAMPGGETSFQEAYDLSRPYMSHRTHIIVITPMEPDDTMVPALTDLALRGRHVIVVSVESFDFQAGIKTYRRPEEDLQSSAIKGAYKESLMKVGIETIDWALDSRPSVAMEVMQIGYG
jgi:uncharacterized protein (DUF58 family)